MKIGQDRTSLSFFGKSMMAINVYNKYNVEVYDDSDAFHAYQTIGMEFVS